MPCLGGALRGGRAELSGTQPSAPTAARPQHRTRAAAAQRQKHRVPAGEGARPFPEHPHGIMALQVSNSASGETEARGEEKEWAALSVCAMPC